MRFLVLLALVGTLVTACDTGGSGSQAGQGGNVTGPSIVINCLTSGGGASQGDTNVNVECPKDSHNPTSSVDGEGK